MKVAYVTGASGGIGAATARELAGRGYALALGYCFGEERVRALAKELERKTDLLTVQADWSVPGAGAAAVQQVLERFGHIDLLVNAAGVAQDGLLTDLSEAAIQKLIDLNLTGSIFTTRAVLHSMIARQEGCIINLSSIWGLVGASCEVVYSAAKAGLIGFTKALAKEVGPSGIRVNCVAPGLVDTPMNAGYTREELAAFCAETPLRRMASAEEIARTVAFLASPDGSFYTGQILSPNGGVVI